jgi:NAD(P)-dependent dehydrogenase (short-subunit alcohol dehydrogenase family)
MDQVLNAVDLVVPPASMVMLAFAWPTLTFLRGVEWVLKTLTKEDMLGKVVVITGASSAIGEVYTNGVSSIDRSQLYYLRLAEIHLEIGSNKNHLTCHAWCSKSRTSTRGGTRTWCWWRGGSTGCSPYATTRGSSARSRSSSSPPTADVVKEEDCRRLVSDTVTYFGQRESSLMTEQFCIPANCMSCQAGELNTLCFCLAVNHLVNTVSFGHDFNFEEAGDTTAFPHLMVYMCREPENLHVFCDLDRL